MSDEELSVVPYEGMEIVFDESGNPWMSQAQIAELLGVTVPNVNTMLSYALKSGDIDENSVIKLRLTAADGKVYNVNHYNLDAILVVGFRSKATNRAVAFRQWVGRVLADYIRSLQREKENLEYTLSEEQREKHQLARQLEDYEEANQRKQRDGELYDWNEL